LSGITPNVLKKVDKHAFHQRIVVERILDHLECGGEKHIILWIADVCRHCNMKKSFVALLKKLVTALINQIKLDRQASKEEEVSSPMSKKHKDLIQEILKLEQPCADRMLLDDAGLCEKLTKLFPKHVAGINNLFSLPDVHLVEVDYVAASSDETEVSLRPSQGRGEGGGAKKKRGRNRKPSMTRQPSELEEGLSSAHDIFKEVLANLKKCIIGTDSLPAMSLSEHDKVKRSCGVLETIVDVKIVDQMDGYNLSSALKVRHEGDKLLRLGLLKLKPSAGPNLDVLINQPWMYRESRLKKSYNSGILTLAELVNKLLGNALHTKSGGRVNTGKLFKYFWLSYLKGILVFLHSSAEDEYYANESANRSYYHHHLLVSLMLMIREPEQKKCLINLITQHFIAHYFLDTHSNKKYEEYHHYENLISYVKSFMVVLSEYMPQKCSDIKDVGEEFCTSLLDKLCTTHEKNLDTKIHAGFKFLYYKNKEDRSPPLSSLPEAPVQVMRVFCALGWSCSVEGAPGKVLISYEKLDLLSQFYPVEAFKRMLDLNKDGAFPFPVDISKDNNERLCGCVPPLDGILQKALRLRHIVNFGMGLTNFEIFCMQNHSQAEKAPFGVAFEGLLSRMSMDDLFENRCYPMVIYGAQGGVFFSQSPNRLLYYLFFRLQQKRRYDLAKVVIDYLGKSGCLLSCLGEDPELFKRYIELLFMNLPYLWESFVYLVDRVPRVLFTKNALNQDLIKQYIICFDDFSKIQEENEISKEEANLITINYFNKLIDLYFVQGVDWQKISWNYILDKKTQLNQKNMMPNKFLNSLKLYIKANIDRMKFYDQFKQFVCTLVSSPKPSRAFDHDVFLVNLGDRTKVDIEKGALASCPKPSRDVDHTAFLAILADKTKVDFEQLSSMQHRVSWR
jgi:hypothetical protein